MKNLNHKRGQTSFEFTVMIVIILGVIISMTYYIKRGIQGRWKTAIDGFGEQYDPRATKGTMNYYLENDSTSSVYLQQVAGETQTWRDDSVNSVETKEGEMIVGAFTDPETP